MSGTLTIILAGGRGERLSVLSQKRVKTAVPLGKYRLIDFTLSNCVKSGLYDVGILTQYQPHSLNDHIRTGQPWDLDRQWSGSVTLLPPCQQANGASDWYRGTADAIYQNLDFVLRHRADTALVGKNTRLPPGLRLGIGDAIGSDMTEDDFCAGETLYALPSAELARPMRAGPCRRNIWSASQRTSGNAASRYK